MIVAAVGAGLSVHHNRCLAAPVALEPRYH
jgi:hypothetical protein